MLMKIEKKNDNPDKGNRPKTIDIAYWSWIGFYRSCNIEYCLYLLGGGKI